MIRERYRYEEKEHGDSDSWLPEGNADEGRWEGVPRQARPGYY